MKIDDILKRVDRACAKSDQVLKDVLKDGRPYNTPRVSSRFYDYVKENDLKRISDNILNFNEKQVRD